MDVETLNQTKRLRLLDLFRQFRASSDENESEFDALEMKLEHGGMLDEGDIDTLLEAVAKTVELSDREYHFYKRKLGRA